MALKYYLRDGILYTTKTMCNGKVTWQKECRVYPSEFRHCAVCFDGRAMRGGYNCRRCDAKLRDAYDEIYLKTDPFVTGCSL